MKEINVMYRCIQSYTETPCGIVGHFDILVDINSTFFYSEIIDQLNVCSEIKYKNDSDEIITIYNDGFKTEIFDVVKYFIDKLSLPTTVYYFIKSLPNNDILTILYIIKGVLYSRGINLNIVEDMGHVVIKK